MISVQTLVHDPTKKANYSHDLNKYLTFFNNKYFIYVSTKEKIFVKNATALKTSIFVTIYEMLMLRSASEY